MSKRLSTRTDRPRGKPIAEVDFDEASYVGSDADGVYVQAAKGRGGWYVSSVVDCHTAGFVQPLVTDDGPYPTEQAALTAGCYGAADWCLDNNVLYRRQLQRCLKAAARATGGTR